MHSRPFALVVAAPSGTGKTTLARALVQNDENLEFSVSATTRPRRTYEKDGRDYYFVDERGFDGLIERGEMLEWAEVHGRRYGTPAQSIRDPLARGRCVVLDIDVQGAGQVKAAFPDAVLVFILPPSVEELHRRLAGRGSEDRRQLHVRLATALNELDAAAGFDYVVVNDEFERALAALRAILAAEQHRRSRVDDLPAELNAMRNKLEVILKESD